MSYEKTRVSDDAMSRGFNGSVNISEKAVTFDHNLTQLLHNFIAFNHKIFLVGIYILNDKVL